MVHIILFTLQILGWILLIIFVLFLLLSLILLFAGFHYKGKVKCLGNIETLGMAAEFSYLFHLIRGRILYEDGAVKWKIRILWKRFSSYKKTEKPVASFSDTKSTKKGTEASKEEKEKVKEKQEDAPGRERTEQRKEPKECVKKNEQPTKSVGGRKKIGSKIRYTFRKICDTIKSFIKKKEYIQTFIAAEAHKMAFKKGIKETKRFFAFLKPDVLEASLIFGFSDPAVTGYVLGGISLIYPFIGEHVQLEPDFENKILKGQAYIQGKIRGIYIVIFLWNMLWNKQVRQTIKDIRNFQF